MKLWLITIGAFVFQELATTNAVLLQLYQNHYSIWLVHLIFVANTAVGITVGYFAGKWVQRKFHDHKLIQYFQKKATGLEGFIGNNGKRLTFVILSLVSFNYVDSFVASWLDSSFGEVFTFFFLGNVLWYALEWAFVLSINSFVVNPYYALYILVALSIGVGILIKHLNDKYLTGKS